MKQHINTELDDQFEKINTLNWLPFVGKSYWQSPDRTLIVGESHYVPVDENFSDYSHRTWTREFIVIAGLQLKPWYQGRPKNNLIREIEKTLCNEENNNVWNELAYFNLIQRLLPSIKGEHRPTYNDIVAGLENFKKLVKLLDPTTIIFCGVEAAKHFYDTLHNMDFRIENIPLDGGKINGAYPRVFTLSYDDSIRRCFFIKHPSMRYSADKWSQLIKAFNK